MLALSSTLYPGQDAAEEQYLQWQYERNPAGRVIGCLAHGKEELAAQYVVLPQRYLINGHSLPGSVSVNTMTHPAHRAKGLFILLAEGTFSSCLGSGVRFTVGFPNRNSYKGFVKHLSFQDLGELPLWIRPLRLGGLSGIDAVKSRPWLRALWSAGAPALDWAASLIDRGPFPQSDSIQEVADFGDAFDTLWERARSLAPNILLRDSWFLDWRFKRHPTRKYRVFLARDDLGAAGYAVLRVDQIRGVPCGLLVDFLVSPDAAEHVGSALVERVTREARESGAAIAGCLLTPRSPLAAHLQSNRFIRCPNVVRPEPFVFIVRWHDVSEPPPGIFDLSRWHLTMGDYDVV